jgi:hypothetical protein
MRVTQSGGSPMSSLELDDRGCFRESIYAQRDIVKRRDFCWRSRFGSRGDIRFCQTTRVLPQDKKVFREPRILITGPRHRYDARLGVASSSIA